VQYTRATSAEEEAGDPDTVVICVPTPLSADSAPDLSAVRGAAQVTGRLLRPGMLVVLESTTYPGTTDEVVRPLLGKASGLTAGTDFSLAFSPERIDPGNPGLLHPQHAQGRRRADPSCTSPRSGSTASSAIRWSGPGPRASRR
jgi:UDP-N-acetyl-D-mannosaminuronate dehydrogenase